MRSNHGASGCCNRMAGPRPTRARSVPSPVSAYRRTWPATASGTPPTSRIPGRWRSRCSTRRQVVPRPLVVRSEPIRSSAGRPRGERRRDATRIETLNREMARRVQGNPFARAAVEMALWDLNGRALGVPVHRLLGGRVRERVPLSWSLAVGSLEAELEEAREKVALGHRIFKIKTAAHPLRVDVERVRRIRETVGPGVALRVDANQGWDRPTAFAAVRALEPYGLDFIEQPLPRWDLDGMAELARRAPQPIM